MAIEALKGHKTISELASEFTVHPTQINTWKRQVLEGARQLKRIPDEEEPDYKD